MKMLFAPLLLAAAITSPAFAADHSGTYHSVESKSFWSNGEFPKGFSLTIDLKFSPNTLEYHAVNDTVKGKPPYKNDFVATLDDQVGPLNDNARFNQIRIKTLGPNTYQVLEQKDGDVIVGQYWEFSKDGKSLVRWGVGKAPDGKSKAFLEWFEKVK
ncbi:hypothetical protein PX554_04905 [Sphingomonas sp. H39-1-10]|uniref:hypothetical protein n=1 Tax=Sphingomonas TaxID=13687 RepID=UPI000891BCCB|nr:MULTISPECIES: hypothetical protein [Sphingomonas]MDF0487459.1 hypothetical protein [Sphingomonas pollutisoli]SDA16260.1 hypothetical protein SAMN03159340_00845 [Sphingomonas sp. NFR15]